MNVALHAPAIAFGAAVAIAVAVPAAVLGQFLVSEGSNIVFVFFVIILVGFAAGGFSAARRAPAAPYTHAALAALAAFALIQIVGGALRLARGEPIPVAMVLFNVLVAYGSGLVGGVIEARTAPIESEHKAAG